MFTSELYVRALRFAAERHQGQLFPGTELPYLVHVASVAGELIAALPGTPALDGDLAMQCALLHDTIEDTATTFDEVAERFGVPVAEGVRALSKDPAVAKPERMADSLRRIRAQPHAVWAVKLADRICNLDTPPSGWTREKSAAYRLEAIEIATALGEASSVLDARLRARIAAYAAYT